jgi:rare lipoprotein A
MAVGALLPIAAAVTPPAVAGAEETTKAEIDASKHSVPIGDRVVLEGSFPGAAKAPIEVAYRAQGASSWQPVADDRTGAAGRYHVRVEPDRSGYWRAELGEPVPASAVPAGVDRDTGTEQVEVRSRTRARVAGRHELVGDRVEVVGTVRPAGAKRRVVVDVGGDKLGTTAGRNGRFRVEWKAPRTGVFDVDARARSNRTATGSRDSAGHVTVYRPAPASWYGPGLYGNALACGGTLSPSTMGVANRSLPCGTKVHLRYGHRSVTVPVIDRGPFAGGREYDLTAATKQALGFPDVGTVLTSR